MDKFAKHLDSQEKIDEFSEYVHLNFKLIFTKMVSEMRRKLDITPDRNNVDGYVSLQLSLIGRLFNESVYSLAGTCQSFQKPFTEIVPHTTILMILDLIEGKNPLGGLIRSDIPNDFLKFQEYYNEHINELRKTLEALPKE